jgi:hypothetical protein
VRNPGFTRFLARSLALLEDELPSVHAEIARRLGLRDVGVDVEGETLVIRSDGQRLEIVLEAHGDEPVFIRTDHAVISGLIQGAFGLLDAVWDERIVLEGRVDDLVAFHDGLMAYLHGAVRAPGFTDLLDAYLGASTNRGWLDSDPATIRDGQGHPPDERSVFTVKGAA